MNEIICGDCLSELKKLESESVDCCITSPPYWGLRDYGVEGQLGLEKTPEEYVAKMVEVFREVKRVLKKEGTLWLNLGDSYAGSGCGRNADGTANQKAGTISKQSRGQMSGTIKKSRFDKWNSGTKNSIQVSHNTPKAQYDGLKPKDLVGIPWRVAFALQADGWWLRQDIIWAKPNPMPESVTDRCTKAHEYIFLMSKSPKYYFEQILEPLVENSDMAYRRTIRAGRKYGTKRPYQDNQPLSYENTKADPNATNKNKRSVWTVNTKPFKEAHFATFPEDLITPMVLAGCPKEGIVLDPFNGSGTTTKMAMLLGRNYIGIDISPEYCEIAKKRLAQQKLI